MMGALTFRVYGTPAPQGSKRHVGRGVMVESSKKVAPWRQDVVAAAAAGRTNREVAEASGVSVRTVENQLNSAYRKLGLDAEARLSGRGVSWCATCDGAFFKDQHIAVVGGGDSAMEEATFLTRFASKVTIIHRSENLRACVIMRERAEQNPKIDWMLNSRIEDITGEASVESASVCSPS